jgi:hypothetical protein
MIDDRVVIGDEQFYPTKVKPNINSIEVHPKLNSNGHLADGVLVGVGSLWSKLTKLAYGYWSCYITKSKKEIVILLTSWS